MPSGEQFEHALGVAASCRGKRGAVVQFGVDNNTANIEPDISGADQIAAGNRRVDIVDGALERRAAPRRAQTRQPADPLIVEKSRSAGSARRYAAARSAPIR